MNEEQNTGVYSNDVIELVTVATEYCVRVERAVDAKQRDFVSSMLKILPLLYIKAMMLTDWSREVDSEVEQFVTEDDYNFVLNGVATVMSSHDDYLDVFVEDMKYSDVPIRKTISEDLADIYQDIRNFVGVYQQGYDEAMVAALNHLMEQFPKYWGQRIPSVMRALHDVYFLQETESEENDNETYE